jgi:Spx/MgsR family transcriptional regulator
MKIYGLKNCDSCRKAFRWVDARGLAYEFIDVRDGSMTSKDIARFVAAAGWETALNRKSTTWRSLAEADRQDFSPEKTVSLIAANPTLLKRPVIDADGTIVIGFDDAAEARLTQIAG